MRGTGYTYSVVLSRIRITPACAGNRQPLRQRRDGPWDHPRVCGEQVRLEQTFYKDLGSPPRVRGTERPPFPLQELVGITPACAGNSKGLGGGVPIKGDHPRVCGEQ